MRTCWSCGAEHDCATSLHDPSASPSDGDAMLCFNCGEWSIFDADAMRRPTFEELAEIVASVECTQVRRTWLKYKEGSNAKAGS